MASFPTQRLRGFCLAFLTVGLLFGCAQAAVSAQSLRGSAASLDRQAAHARRHSFPYLSNTAQLRELVDAGLLVQVADDRDYTLVDVSFPFVRPEARLFIERLAAQYRRTCDERLVVTSLTRPMSRQPRNASDRSVHPTGMAIDLRRPAGRCRAWLESVLLSLEASGVIEATLERRPPHYHVAVFPAPYAAYVKRLTARGARRTGASPAVDRIAFHVVRRGDTLTRIARRHGASLDALRRANGLTSSRIYPGQALKVPSAQP